MLILGKSAIYLWPPSDSFPATSLMFRQTWQSAPELAQTSPLFRQIFQTPRSRLYGTVRGVFSGQATGHQLFVTRQRGVQLGPTLHIIDSSCVPQRSPRSHASGSHGTQQGLALASPTHDLSAAHGRIAKWALYKVPMNCLSRELSSPHDGLLFRGPACHFSLCPRQPLAMGSEPQS